MLPANIMEWHGCHESIFDATYNLESTDSLSRVNTRRHRHGHDEVVPSGQGVQGRDRGGLLLACLRSGPVSHHTGVIGDRAFHTSPTRKEGHSLGDPRLRVGLVWNW